MNRDSSYYDVMVSQAADTNQRYLSKAVAAIDSQFGEEGYAAKHPELIAAFIVGCNADYRTTIFVTEIANALSEIAIAIKGDS